MILGHEKQTHILCKDTKLEKLLQAALGADWINLESSPPGQVSLNARLMWEVLELACSNCNDIASSTGNGLLHWSLASTDSTESRSLEEIVFEVGATSPDITIDTADGGQSAPISMGSSGTPAPSRSYPGMAQPTGVQTLTFDELTNYPSTSWLGDGNTSMGASIHTYDLQTGALEAGENATWWNFGDF